MYTQYSENKILKCLYILTLVKTYSHIQISSFTHSNLLEGLESSESYL